ncbi:hypothetical protein BJ878DRAFT_570723 [Calycina marina]|uniref:F-box domain-containing protein n=1 Tax=Calycina marina TaxID=1763456 RepID=A0A9P7YX00_9HELO|nr:hypothetical protein BJ878DRAFT_570723 [Calycina marina]
MRFLQHTASSLAKLKTKASPFKHEQLSTTRSQAKTTISTAKTSSKKSQQIIRPYAELMESQPKKPSHLHRLPPEIRGIIFGMVLHERPKSHQRFATPELLAALRCDPVLYQQALYRFYRLSEFRMSKWNRPGLDEMGLSAIAGIRTWILDQSCLPTPHTVDRIVCNFTKTVEIQKTYELKWIGPFLTDWDRKCFIYLFLRLSDVGLTRVTISARPDVCEWFGRLIVSSTTRKRARLTTVPTFGRGGGGAEEPEWFWQAKRVGRLRQDLTWLTALY